MKTISKINNALSDFSKEIDKMFDMPTIKMILLLLGMAAIVFTTCCTIALFNS
jgi:phage gp36-like protein